MSLRVWLPFTDGTLKQQGLSNEIATSGGTINLTNTGKLGKCATFGSAAGGITIPASTMTSFTNCSVAFWLKINGWGSSYDTYFQAGTGSTPWNNYIFGFLRNNTNSTICFTISNGSSASNTNYLTSALSINTWYHIVLTYETGKCKTYLNGVLDHEYSTTIVPAFDKITKITLGRCNNDSSYQAQCSINDFRIYDHCLSPMEVKELSKGLVLHYPLNRGGWGQENNIKTSIVQNHGCSNFVYNSSTNEWTMTCPTGSTTWGYGIVLNDRAIAWKVSETWLISMEVYTPRSITWNCDINNKPDLDDISGYTGNDYDITGQRLVCTNGVQGSKTLQVGWNKLWFSQTANTTYGLTNYSTNCGVVTTNETSAIDIKVKNIKGEIIGPGLTLQPTPWCPNSSDALATAMGLNGTTEYDTSGYCNNGEKIGALTYTSDTPKYQVSTHIGSTSSKIHISNFPTSGFGNSYSFAWWGKRTSNNPMFWGFSDGIRLNGMYIGTLWNTGDGSNNPLYKIGTTTQVTAPSVNVWHHYVMIGNGTKCYVYLDGELWAEAKTYKAISGTSIYINGWNSTTDYCSDNTDISDFRIYATALSADDVKSLYQNSAYIDSSGNVYGAVHSEA